MEFITFLASRDKEILDLIYKAGYRVEENTPLCLLGKGFFGFLKRRRHTVVICTENAKYVGGYSIPGSKDNDYSPTKIYIRRALRHEAVHVAQDCNNGNLLKMVKEGSLKVHPYKLRALKGSSRVSGNKKREYEAYALEDKPRIVKAALKKYCL